MKQNGLILAGLFIAIGLFFGGYQINRGMTNMKASERVITVKGLSEREFPADKVTWPIIVKEAGNDLVELYNKIEKNNQKIISFLVSNGITESEISVSPADIIDYQTERYASRDIIFRYNGTSIITVSSKRIDEVRVLIPRINELLREGITISANREYENPIIYEFTQLNEVKPQMIEEATRNARTSAEKFASDSQSKLGKIKTANQGQFSIADRDVNTPHIKTVRVVTTINYFLKD